jgi:hypothetical protein
MSGVPGALGGPLADAVAAAPAAAAQALQQLAAPAADARAKADALAAAAQGQGAQALGEAQSQAQQAIQAAQARAVQAAQAAQAAKDQATQAAQALESQAGDAAQAARQRAGEAAQAARQAIQAAQAQAQQAVQSAQAAAAGAAGQAAQAASAAVDAATDQIANAFNPQQVATSPGLPCGCGGHIPPAFDGATAAQAVATALAGAAMADPAVQACLGQASALDAFAQQLPGDLPVDQLAAFAQQASDAQRAISEQLASALPPALSELMQSNNLAQYGDALGPSVAGLVAQGRSYEDVVQSAAQQVPDPRALADQYGDLLAQQGDDAIRRAQAALPAVPELPAEPALPGMPDMPAPPAAPLPSLPSFGR